MADLAVDAGFFPGCGVAVSLTNNQRFQLIAHGIVNFSSGDTVKFIFSGELDDVISGSYTSLEIFYLTL